MRKEGKFYKFEIFIPEHGQWCKNFISGQLFSREEKPAPGRRRRRIRERVHVCNARPELITRRRRG